MVIRPARENELERLSELAMRSKASWGYSEAFMHACRQELTVGLEQLPFAFVGEARSVIVGFYTVSRLDAERAELDFLFVEPALLRRGYGMMLVRHAKDQARRLGCRRLVIQGDPNAEAFYTAAGAVKVGERPSDSIEGRMLPLYEIMLDGRNNAV